MYSLNLLQIKKLLKKINAFPLIEQAFIDYSNKQAVTPPVGELSFNNPPGTAHIKYGYLLNSPYYVVKIASLFENNNQLNLSKTQGVMLLFDKNNGQLVCSLRDEAYLTNIRTAIAGAIAAKYLAPKKITALGVLGAGKQAILQIEYLVKNINFKQLKNIIICGRAESSLSKIKENIYENKTLVEFFKKNSTIKLIMTTNINELSTCQLIITTTPSKQPILMGNIIQPGTHITAIGSDTYDKQELDSSILTKADAVIADSISQCLIRGEIHHAIQKGVISRNKLLEIGDIISGKSPGRTTEKQITIFDSTGVSVQDIAIAQAVYEKYNENKT